MYLVRVRVTVKATRLELGLRLWLEYYVLTPIEVYIGLGLGLE